MVILLKNLKAIKSVVPEIIGGGADLPAHKFARTLGAGRVKANVTFKWKSRWLRQNSGSTYVETIDENRKIRQIYSRDVEVKVFRMILQHTKLE